ncbi:sigma-70 family RNA polymerase sigma factor [bacterium]|nr:sigma-70 family RNA polymerase sigma factor [bacterium]
MKHELENISTEDVDDLPESERRIIYMFYKDGKSLKEIGETLEISRERVRQLKKKAIRRLKVKESKKSFWNNKEQLADIGNEERR